MTTNETIQKAIAIFKSTGVTGIGKCRAYVSESNSHVVDIFTADGLYCSINVRSGAIKGM